jgi:hypothetical protein
MKTKAILFLFLLSLVAAGCERVELKREVPTSPIESYQPLPK